MTTYSISVQAAGCLPDSDAYPYTVEGLDAAVDAILHEIQYQAVLLHDVEEWNAEDIRRDLADGVLSLEIAGTYSLEAIEV